MMNLRPISATIVLAASVQSAQTAAVSQFRLERELFVDAAQHDLTTVGWLAVARSGAIVIAQEQDHNVRFFSAQGTPIRTFGRQGQGPGEFAMMTLHGWVGDTLWVADGGNSRFTFIGPNGNLVRSRLWTQGLNFAEGTPLPRPSVLAVPPWAVYSDGSSLVLAYPAGEQFPMWMKRPEGMLMGFLRVNAQGQFDRVIAWTHGPVEECRISTRAGTRPLPFCFRPFWAVSRRGGVIFTAAIERSDAQSDYVRTIAVNAVGDTLLSHLLSVPKQRIPRAVADSVREGFMRLLIRSVGGATKSVDLPETFPPFEQAIVSIDEKTIWLESGVATGDREWRIIDLNGRHVGSVRVPRSIHLHVVSLDRVWATERDQDGLESIAVYRVRR
jgi:hypothetical protein